ncbi:MAG: histidinol-phosphate transaminase [Erysipelotrichales bacterium]
MKQELKDLKVYPGIPEGFINLATNEVNNTKWNEILNYNEILKSLHLDEYGNSKHEILVDTYAKYIGLDNSNIICGPGSDSLIPLLINALTTRNIMTISKDFFRYKDLANILQREVYEIEHSSNMFKNAIDIISKNKIELFILSNPNNPLGIVYSINDIRYLLDNSDCYIVVDEAYMEFSDQSVVDLIKEYDKLIVLKTLSKAWGLAKLRVGFCLSNAQLIDYLKAVQGPFVLSDINATIANETLKNNNYLINNIIQVNNTKKEFINNLDNSLEVYDSHTNFVYIKCENAVIIHKALLDNKILVARFEDALRISIGSNKVMNEVSKIINNTIKDGK